MTFCVCIFRSKNIVFVSFVVRDFDSKVLLFLFLNTEKWFRQEINAYGDLLQNERHVLKHVSNLQNEKSRFWSVFQLYKISKKFLKHISSLQSETTRRVYKNNEEKRFWSVFQVCMMKKSFLKRFHVYTMKKTRFWSIFKFTTLKNMFLKCFQVYNMKISMFLKPFQVYKRKRNKFLMSFQF